MREIQINDIQEDSCYLYNSEGVFLGMIHNELQFNDIRIQIRDGQRRGYYIEYLGQRYNIEPSGRIENRPRGLFDTALMQTRDLIRSF